MKDSDKLACCNICLLADAMKFCQSCPLNPGKLKLTNEQIKAVTHKNLLDQKGEIK